MSARTIFITKSDMDRLMDLIEGIRGYNKKNNDSLDMLEQELNRGTLVDPEKVPPDVVTMNSRVSITDMDSGEKKTYSLVFPSNAKIDENKLSILAPLGIALLGYREGDIIEAKAPSGIKKLRINEVIYQPEAFGQFDM